MQSSVRGSRHPYLRCAETAILTFFCLVAAETLATEPAASLTYSDASPSDPREILRAAFDNYYGCDTRAEVEFVIRTRQGAERHRVLEIAAKHIDGRRRGLARVTSPPYLRGMSFLTIENGDRSRDGFVYLPSQRRVRRVTTAQSGDAFLGSDLTHEDIQRRRVEDFEVEFLPPERIGDERAHVILARPRVRTAYDRLHILTAAADAALLGVRYFKRDSDAPYRVIRMPRVAMQAKGGHVLPTRIEVESLDRGSKTEVTFRDLEVNPDLNASAFEPSWLERDRSSGRFTGP